MATTQQDINNAKAEAERIKAQVEAAKAKVAEAQAKIAEARAQVAAAIAKFEKAKALAQAVTAAYRAGGLKGGLAAIVASQVGNIRGELVSQVNKRVNEAINKLINQCPPEKDLQRIVKTKNNLQKVVTNFDKRVQSFRPVATNLSLAATIIELSIEVITSIPTPTAIIPPQTGGVGIPINVLTKYSDSLVKLNTRLAFVKNQANTINTVVDSVGGVTQGLRSKLDSLDKYIERCYLEKLDSTDNLDTLNAGLAAIQPKENTGSEGTPNANYEYKGYKLEIIQDINSPSVAPKRFAIGKDRRGIIVLQGPSSFSADTQVLLDEIKFRIDNQLA